MKSTESYTDRYARWHNMLNGFKWAEDMPGKPKDFDALPDVLRKPHQWNGVGSKAYYITPLMKTIEQLIGWKATLKWHHLHNLNRSHLAFEWWWINHYGFLRKLNSLLHNR